MMKAFAYVRVSTDRQELSPEAQRTQVTAYCVAKGLELVAVFEETGVSGSVPLGERDSGGAMLARLGEVDAVVFSKLDRAFRDTVDAIVTTRALSAAGKAIHFLDLGVDTSTPAGQLCLQMMAAFAEFERRRISERTREALRAHRRSGKRSGGCPLGFRATTQLVDGKKVNAGVWARVEEEQAVIERVVALRKRRWSLREIVAQLNEEGAKTRRGGMWAPETIRRILRRAS